MSKVLKYEIRACIRNLQSVVIGSNLSKILNFDQSFVSTVCVFIKYFICFMDEILYILMDCLLD